MPAALTRPLDAAAYLAKFALDSGGLDNITVVIIPFPPLPTPSRAAHRGHRGRQRSERRHAAADPPLPRRACREHATVPRNRGQPRAAAVAPRARRSRTRYGTMACSPARGPWPGCPPVPPAPLTRLNAIFSVR